MSTVVISKCVASEAYQADLSVADEGLKLVSACEGVLGNYHGLLEEDKSVGYSVQVATSPEAFLAVVADTEKFNAIMEKCAVTRVGGVEQWHFNAISDPFKALVGPLTEISRWTLKEPTPDNKQTVDNILTEFNKITEGKLTYGWLAEDANTCIVLAAWDSAEAHKERGKEADAVEGLTKLFELADPNGGPFHHLKLVKV